MTCSTRRRCAVIELQQLQAQLAELQGSANAKGEIETELRKLLGRRDALLAQQRDIDEQIAKLKLEAIRIADQKKSDDIGRNLGIEIKANAQQAEIECAEENDRRTGGAEPGFEE